ncbi:hypothetical protein [Flavobacterium johnsoniae]|uniref:Uncharacterized protein n=1 Tax=Flavobacterium johnsoniae (strain ATCC 17061 / DSM 2064 / JCM 8514 / BCRC 14874 / CCUG 350202 / NBRC 14942 / NCIMB 11054 / UW101) TaxID=376686 RepID=A5FLH5_FLAJ1|nr:hypothetical protein [Flavobacterium johnsoniae]ABQ03950.1 hypothetical protein Fjoh_0916 [Flavobacterium johnsoniae UW101]OXE96180.1 hypothetical protein B0A63_21945 [Flavobacterium johnsoniae UW101]WQG79183.1 hypothetical protein SR927_14265 [Flavobacterium johnsoniae UW101]SHK07663.1 hypothetical protein SAMN05444146_0320 [Flavobacterium johnsoniae]
MKFTKKDLHFKDYSWAADGGDNPHYKGDLDKEKVDKTEGYEVVYFCNDFLVTYDKELTKENFQKIERLLREELFRKIEKRSELNKSIYEYWNFIEMKNKYK